MNKHDFFVEACKAHRWKWRAWRISIFAVTRRQPPIEGALPSIDDELETYDLDYRRDGTYWYSKELDTWSPLEDAVPLKPLFAAATLADFKEGDIPLSGAPAQTTYGRMLFNWLVIYYAFGTKIPFQHRIKPTDLVKVFAPHTVHERAEVDDESKIFRPSEIGRYVQALFELPSLTPYLTPTGSEKILRTHPDMAKLRAKLIKEAGDRINDPVVITEIQNKLIALDKEWLATDEARLYYLSGKDYSIKRKKMFVMHGIEGAFSEKGEFTFIPKSLDEGWDMNNLPAINNAIREGSYDRGVDTALGGEKVTFLQRIYQNAKVIPGDCGTKIVDRRVLRRSNYKIYIGFNMVTPNGLVRLTNDNAESYIGKIVSLRRPILCKSPYMDFCEQCATVELARSPRAVASEISAIGSEIMGAFMSSMHGVELAVSEYSIEEHIV